MKTMLSATALASVLLVSSAFAQMPSSKEPAPRKTESPRTTETPPAVSNPMDTNKTTAAPVEGKNSFTEAQAMTRFTNNGYSAVTELKKDDKQIWHAAAMKNGKKVMVALDYQGNITTKP